MVPGDHRRDPSAIESSVDMITETPFTHGLSVRTKINQLAARDNRVPLTKSILAAVLGGLPASGFRSESSPIGVTPQRRRAPPRRVGTDLFRPTDRPV